MYLIPGRLPIQFRTHLATLKNICNKKNQTTTFAIEKGTFAQNFSFRLSKDVLISLLPTDLNHRSKSKSVSLEFKPFVGCPWVSKRNFQMTSHSYKMPHVPEATGRTVLEIRTAFICSTRVTLLRFCCRVG